MFACADNFYGRNLATMPARKRALEQSDANAQSTRDPKQQKRDEAAKDAENQDPTQANNSGESEVIYLELYFMA